MVGVVRTICASAVCYIQHTAVVFHGYNNLAIAQEVFVLFCFKLNVHITAFASGPIYLLNGRHLKLSGELVNGTADE